MIRPRDGTRTPRSGPGGLRKSGAGLSAPDPDRPPSGGPAPHPTRVPLLPLAVLILYLLPSGLGTLARLAHQAEHVLQAQIEAAASQSRAGLVHSHDGTTHAHGPGVEALASVAGELEGSRDDEEGPEVVPPLVLLGLRPPASAAPERPDASRAPPAAFTTLHWIRRGPAPPVPPPRA